MRSYIPGGELAGIRCGVAPARQPDGLISPTRLLPPGVPSGEHSRRPAGLFRAGDRDGADAARRVPRCSASDRRSHLSTIRLLGLDLAAPDRTILSRRIL